MSIYAVMFYVLGAVIVAATALAITRRNLMHAIVYLVLSFIGTALLFYLLGAPFLAVLEVVIYAGAIMVLFLFIVMMLEIKPEERTLGPFLRQWLPALALSGICLMRHVRAYLLLDVGQPRAFAPGHGLAPGLRPVSLPEILVRGGNCVFSPVRGPGGGALPGPERRDPEG